MIPNAYEVVTRELAVQSNKMNALSVAMEYQKVNSKCWDRLFDEFGDASILVAALDSAKRKIEESWK